MENNERQVMGETEKRFKIQKIEKYEEMIDEIEKFNTMRIVVFGMCTVATMFDVVMAGHDFTTNNLISAVAKLVVAFVSGGVTSNIFLSPLLDGISKKTSLQNNIDMLKDELELNEALEEETKTKTL